MEIVYDDNHIVIVNKSAGELVQGDRTGDPTLIDSVKAWLKEKYNSVRGPMEPFGLDGQ